MKDPHKALQAPSLFEPLDAKIIKKFVPNNGNIYVFKSIDSTSDWLKKQGECGDICISETQTNGRGRRGNRWESPNSGNIYFSLNWCFKETNENWSLLGLVVGIAVAEALKEFGLTGHSIKWPNDIFWQQKKMGGILIESINQSGNIVIGIGLNISMPSHEENKIDQAICSLEQALCTYTKPNNEGAVFSRNQLIIKMIQHLSQHLTTFSQFNFDNFIKQWKNWDLLNGKSVNFMHQGSLVSGKVIEVDQKGRLGILDNTGNLAFFSSIDIKLNPLNHIPLQEEG